MANILIPEGIWAGTRLSKCSWIAQLHFPRIYVYGDQYACFEIALGLMYATIYPLVMDQVSLKDLEGFLGEYEDQGLLFTWTQNSKRFGYYPGVSQGRLLPPSKRFQHYKRATPDPPKDLLTAYCIKFHILDDSFLGIVESPTHPLPTGYPPSTHQVTNVQECGAKNKIEKENKNINTGLKSPDSVDNLGIEDDLVVEKIDNLREKLGQSYWKDDVHKWTIMQIKLKTKVRAILFALMAVDKKRPSNPWGYAETVLQDYNDGKYFQKDNIFQDIVEKLKKL